MSLLELAFANGQLAALKRPKLGWLATTHPVVQESGLLKSQPSVKTPAIPPAPSSPAVVSTTFDRHEQGETRVEPRRKLSAEICTTCRKPKHYGSCSRPIPIPTKAAAWSQELTELFHDLRAGGHLLPPALTPHANALLSGEDLPLHVAQELRQWVRPRPRPPAPVLATPPSRIPDMRTRVLARGGYEAAPPGGWLSKHGDFNLGMTSDTSTDSPSVSPHYHSATSSDSALARARDGRPADEQASSMFADLYRNLGIANQADQSTQNYEGLSKVSQFMLPGTELHSMSEQRGPSVNPYDEHLVVKTPPVARGYAGDQAITHAFDQVDGAADVSGIGSGASPTPGPLG